MQNLNDPKLTNQERQQILKLAIDADYRKKYEQAKEQGPITSSNSYWVIQPEDLIKLNGLSSLNDTLFDFYKKS